MAEKTPSLLTSSIALLAQSARATAEDSVRHIPVEDLTPDPDQPRQRFEDSPAREDDTTGGFDALVASIKLNGIIEPLLVYRDQADRLLVLAGERRLRAARAAGLTHVPCLERNINDLAAKLRIQLSENFDRKSLSLYELAGGLARLVEALDGTKTKQELAAELGLAPQRLSDLLFLVSNKAAPETRSALRLDVITDTLTARNFNKLEDDQRKALLQQAIDNKRPIRRAELAAFQRDEAAKALAGDPDAETTARIRLPDAGSLKPPVSDAPPVDPARTSTPKAATREPQSSPGQEESDPPPPDATPAHDGRVHLPPLTRPQLETLYVLLGATAEPPVSEADVAASFLALIEVAMG